MVKVPSVYKSDPHQLVKLFLKIMRDNFIEVRYGRFYDICYSL